MPTLPAKRAIILVVCVCVLIGFLAVVVVGSQPAACVSCHKAQGAYRLNSSHSKVSCYECHLTSSYWSYPAAKIAEIGRMYPAQLLHGGKLTGPVTVTSRQACLHCHAGVLDAVAEGNGLRILHAKCAVGASCDQCHSQVPHGKASRLPRTPVMDDCVACHKREGASVKCTACHSETKRETERSVSAPWQVTHGRNWQSTHGMGDLDSCSTCHAPTYCVRCHGVALPHDAAFGAQHGQIAKTNPAACEGCHQTDTFCNACHGIQMPHPAGFLKVHATVAHGTDDQSCHRCHSKADCGRCHSYHVHPGGSVKPGTPAGGGQ